MTMIFPSSKFTEHPIFMRVSTNQRTSDIEANIQRCHERIEDGIMPQWWVEKLQIYEAEQRKIEITIGSMPQGLSWKVITRIKNLEKIQEYLLKNGDLYNQLVNVNALIEAYRSKKLDWDGQVTYLSNGAPLARMKFHWGDVHMYNDRCNGDSFWVEGVCCFTLYCFDLMKVD